MPSFFVCDERALQTSATRELGRYDLQSACRHPYHAPKMTHSTMRTMESSDLPTLVPPYF